MGSNCDWELLTLIVQLDVSADTLFIPHEKSKLMAYLGPVSPPLHLTG